MRTILFALLAAQSLSAADVATAWERDWKAAFAKAQQAHKLVFVDFYATWCVPCRMMDERVLPAPEVAENLSDFVLLRIDVDRSPDGRRLGIRTLPTFAVFDPWERERFRIVGSHPVDPFAKTLAMIRARGAALVTIGASLNAGETADAFSRLGTVYRSAGALVDARDAFGRAKKLAARANDIAAAQRAEIDSATTWTLEGKPRQALPALEKAAAHPASPDTAVLAWLGIARCRRMLNDEKGARDAEQRALAACTNDEMRKQAEAVIAAMPER